VGTPQGGPLSPLLANIYLHYFLDERFQEVYGKSPYVKMLRYADDFVIVGKSALDIKVVGRLLRVWMKEAGLSLKEAKTRVVDMSNEARSHQSKFEFLGFKFHLRSYKDNAQRFWIARQPSEKSRYALHQRIRAALYPGLSLEQAKEKILSIWKGWTNYFRYSNGNRIFSRELVKVRNYVSWFMGRKFRRQRRPVPWGKLYAMARPIYCALHPVSVRPDHLAANTQMRFGQGRA